MTANLETMMKFRDLQVAEDYAKMVELGYMEKEFDIYGCVYFANGVRKYLISEKEEKIVDFILAANKKGQLVSNIMPLQRMIAVPLGREDQVLYDTEKELASQLQKAYPIQFFKTLEQLNSVEHVDFAYSFLKQNQEELIGVYDFDTLQCFEALLEMAWQRKIVKRSQYCALKSWLENVYYQMKDDVVVTDVFSKKMWGIVYLENDSRKVYVNAKRESVYLRKIELEEEGYIVTPLFHKIYGYNYTYKINDVRNDFMNEILGIMDEEYLKKMYHLRSWKTPIEGSLFYDYCKTLDEMNLKDAKKCLMHYGVIWGII